MDRRELCEEKHTYYVQYRPTFDLETLKSLKRSQCVVLIGKLHVAVTPAPLRIWGPSNAARAATTATAVVLGENKGNKLVRWRRSDKQPAVASATECNCPRGPPPCGTIVKGHPPCSPDI